MSKRTPIETHQLEQIDALKARNAELVKLLRQTCTILDQSNGWAGHGGIFDKARAILAANEKGPPA